MLARQTGSAQAGSYCWPLIRPLGYDAADEPPRPHAGAGLLMLSVMATPAQADAGCQFQLGFRALHDLDPDDVGECLEERHSAANGDAQQRTSRGLLAWRKADNWTAFTDGARTWINGPAGLVTRANTERFSWEASEPAASAPPVSPPAGASHLEKRSLDSQALGRTMPYSIYLPAGYDSSPQRRYPALYLLHSLGGSLTEGGHNTEWPDYGLLDAADRLIGAGTIAPLIIVLPQGDASFWMDAAGGGPRYGAYTAQDVVSEIDGHYRTLADRDHRAIGGLSMGGFGALGLAMLYPATFGTAGAHSPALWGLPGPAIFGDATYFGQHDPLQLLHKQPATARGLRLWLDIGDRDPLDKDRAEALHQQLLQDGAPHLWREWPGDHSVTYWSAHLDDYLRFYDAALR